MKKALTVLTLISVLMIASSVIAQNQDCTPKIGWIPLPSSNAKAKGTDKQVQYNDNGNTAGTEVYYDKTSGKLGIGETNPIESLDVNGNVKANTFIGDGSNLTGVVSSESDPTVQASVKDGVDWSEVTNIPADIADGDQVGVTTETDPTELASGKDGVSWG